MPTSLMRHGLNLHHNPISAQSDSRIFANWILQGAGPFGGWNQGVAPRLSDTYPAFIDETTGTAAMTTGSGIDRVVNGVTLASIPDFSTLRIGFRGTGKVVWSGWLAGPPYNEVDNRPGNPEGHAQGSAYKTTPFIYAQSQGQMTVRIVASDPADHVRDVWVGLDSDGDQTYTQNFLDNIAPFDCLRFMDWQDTNSPNPGCCNTWRHYGDQDRPGLTPYEMGTIPWRYWVELANTTGKDIWVNTPALFDEDACRRMGAYFATNLNPGIKIYVEHSNETWNFAFAQYNLQIAEHDADPDPNKPENAGWPYIFYRGGRAAHWFYHGAKDANPGRDVVRVLAQQAGYYATLETAIENWALGPFGIDAISPAPYIGISEAFEAVRLDVAALYGTNPTAATDQLFADLAGPGINNSKAWIDHWITRAATVPNGSGGTGVPVLIYEINDSVVEPFNPTMDALYVPSHGDPRWYDILTDFINYIKDRVALCNWYFDVGEDSKYGGWGLRRRTAEPLETAHKMRAVLDAIGGVVGGFSAGSLSASVGSPTAAHLSWTAPHGGTAPYTTQLFRDGVSVSGATTSPFDDEGLTTGHPYTYKVRYTDSASPPATAESATRTVTPSAGGGSSLVAGTLSGAATSSTTVHLSWTAASGGTAPYTAQLYRDGVAVSGGTTSPFDDGGRTPGVAYTYKVRYTDSAGTPATADSADLVVTTTTGVGPPSGGGGGGIPIWRVAALGRLRVRRS